MASRVEGLAGPTAVPAWSTRGSGLEAAMARSRRELRPGLMVAFFYAWSLAMARFIDVSNEGIAMLVFGTSFSMVVALAAFLSPRWYLPLLVAYLPFAQAYPLPLGGLSGANMTNFLLLLGPVAWFSGRLQRRQHLRVGRTELLVLVFVAVSSLSLVNTYGAGVGLGEMALNYRSWVAPMVFFFLARGLVRDREDVDGLLRVLAWTSFLVAADTWKEGIDRGVHGSIDRSRVPGLMQQPNSMGAFLAYYGVPLLAMALLARPRGKAVPYVLGFLVAARATLYTFSRGAYLAFAGGSATVLLFGNPLLLAAGAGGGVATLVAFPSLIPSSIRERVSDTTTEQSGIYGGENTTATLDRSNALRLVIWRGAARIIAEHPLIGVGMGRFPETIGHYTAIPLKRDDPHDAHNAYLLQAAEMGIPSLVLLLLLFVLWGLAALRLFRKGRHPVDRRLGLVFMGSLVAVLVSCMFGSRFSDDSLVGWFWILAAMAVVAVRLPGPGLRPGRRRA